MVRPIMKDILFLGQKFEEATEKDRQVIADLREKKIYSISFG